MSNTAQFCRWISGGFLYPKCSLRAPRALVPFLVSPRRRAGGTAGNAGLAQSRNFAFAPCGNILTVASLILAATTHASLTFVSLLCHKIFTARDATLRLHLWLFWSFAAFALGLAEQICRGLLWGSERPVCAVTRGSFFAGLSAAFFLRCRR